MFEKINLNNLNLLDIGNKIQIAGMVMSDEENDYLCYLPEQTMRSLKVLEMDTGDWEKFIRQTDQLETEILAKDKTGKLAKVIVRKSARQIEAGISWKVFARDNYTCRYCGISEVPMTVDHLICWESGGPSIEANLITSCRKCNKLRGCTDYIDWLKSKDYIDRSVSVSEAVKKQNLELVATLDKIPRKYNLTSR